MPPFTNDMALDARIEERLERRLADVPNYTHLEIDTVTNLDCRLFPPGFELSEEASKEFRTLCQTSQVTIPRPTMFSSHRKYLGPLIVFAKKLTWPLVQIHLKQTLTSMSEFNSQVVMQLAKNHVQGARSSSEGQQSTLNGSPSAPLNLEG